MKKIQEIKLLISLFMSFAFAEIDPILDEVEKCWPSTRFGFVTYNFKRPFSDENCNDQVKLFGNSPPRLIGVRNSMAEYDGNVTLSKSALNIVIDPFQYVMSSDINRFDNESWLFHFQLKRNYLDQFVLSLINDYFIGFRKINLRSRIYVWLTLEKEKRLFEVYRKMFAMNLTISELCRVEENNVAIKNENQIWTRRKNLTGVHLKVAYQPTAFLNTENNTFSGLLFNIFSVVQSKLNFSYTMVQTTDINYGTLNESTGNWNGIIGMLQRNEVDLTIMDITILQERSKVIDFSSAIMSDGFRFFTAKPKQSVYWTTFFDVFNIQFWLVVLLMSAVMATFLYIETSIQNENVNLKRITLSVEAVFYSFIGQGIEINPKGVNVRILLFLICVTGSIVYWSYCAGLVSSLTVEKYHFPITTFPDLVVNTQYSLVTLKNSASFKIVVNNAFNTNTVEDKKWMESFQKRSNSFPESIGLAEKFLLENSKTILFAPSIPIKESMTHYPCLITTTSQVLFREDIAWGFPKESPYLEVITHQLNRIKESGLIKKLIHEQMESKSSTPCEDEPLLKPISYENILVAFFILPIGILISAITFLVERVNKN